MRKKLFAASAAVLTLASLVVGSKAEAAPQRVDVQAGALHPTNEDAPYEYTHFYPQTVRVHRGQSVRWNVFGFHTITFSKAGRPALLRPDDVPGTYATPERWALGSDCGRNGLKPCVLKSGTKFLSSGTPPFGNSPFDVKVDAPVGKYTFFCAVHPGMKGTVEVVRPSTRVPAASEIKARIATEVRRDSDAADALFRADQRPVSKVDAEGTRVWRVLLGDSTPNDHVAILAFMPAETNIAAGERVRFAYRDRIDNEVHTVTFPTELSGSPGPPPYGLGGLGFLPACDFDDPSTGMKGVPGLWGVMGPDCPANLELVLQPWMTEAHPAPGNQVLTRATYHDSAMLLPPRAPKNFRTLPDSGKLLPPAFEAEFPAPGTFTFECDVHVDLMTGSINAS